MDDNVTDFMPKAPQGYYFAVIHPEWYQRELTPLWLRPLTVVLEEDVYWRTAPGQYLSITPNATARNTPGSVRRAAQRALNKHLKDKADKAKLAAFQQSEKGKAKLAKARLRGEQALADKERKKAQAEGKFGHLTGKYPPKKLTSK